MEYFHVTSCEDGGKAEFNADFAKKVYQAAKKRALKNPNKGYLALFDCWSKSKLSEKGGMFHKPGKSYSVKVRNMPKKPANLMFAN